LLTCYFRFARVADRAVRPHSFTLHWTGTGGYDGRSAAETLPASECPYDMQPMPTESGQSDTGLKCPKCGYNLTAVTSNRCPECGEQFVLTNAQGYLAKFPPSKLRQACSVVWIIGTAVIVLSWFNVVPHSVGWIGFGIASLAWLVSLSLKR
jgi:hypothetical protein